MSRRLRRSASLVLYWEDGRLVCEDYLTHEKAEVSPAVVELLDRVGEGTAQPPSSLNGSGSARDGGKATSALARLEKLGFVRGGVSSLEKGLKQWRWGGAARHFFFSTKDAHKPAPRPGRRAYARKIMAAGRPPRLYKTYPGARPIALERPSSFQSPVCEAISRVQNVRAYRLKPIPLAHLNEILYLTWGERGKVQSDIWGSLLDKTSYSGGNRHPVEVYPVVVAVEGLRPGLYHYNVKNHALELLKGGNFSRLVRRIGNEQEWIRDASVYFLMTGVFARTMWKYRHDYALRTVFCDLGHLSQNLYLSSQGLDLGACTTYALNHGLAEKLIGLDGVGESVLALSMVGVRIERL